MLGKNPESKKENEVTGVHQNMTKDQCLANP
jgi:hypothetical protein